MRQFHIGDVVVTRLENGRRIPLGIVTDRDIVIGVVATDLAPNALTVGDIMGKELATAQESEDVFDAITQPSDTESSSSRSTFFFTSIFSTIASTTTSVPTNPE